MTQASDQPDAASGTPTKPKRTVGAYETPTPEKIAFGKRMREAREIADMTITEAAVAMGYSQPVHLSLMETGQRLPTLRVLIHCAAQYGVTMDYLAGLTTDSDPDPAITIQREIASRVAVDTRHLISVVTASAVAAVRALRPDAARTARLASQVLEVAAALGRLRERDGEYFDDLHCGAQVVHRLDAAVTTAHAHLVDVARAQRRAPSAPVDFSAAVGIDAVGDIDGLAARLSRPLTLHADDLAEVSLDDAADITSADVSINDNLENTR